MPREKDKLKEILLDLERRLISIDSKFATKEKRTGRWVLKCYETITGFRERVCIILSF